MDRAELRIEKALAELGSEYHPPLGWEARVLAATRRPRRRRWVVAASLVAAAALVLLWWAVRDRRPTFELEPVFASVPSRGEATQAVEGVRATVRRGRYRAVWVYRDDRLVFACPGAPKCRTEGGVLAVTVPFDLPGHYIIVELADDEPLPAPRGSYDQDFAGAQEAGVPHKKADWTVR